MAELQTERDDETEAIRKEAQVGFTRAVFGLPDDLDKDAVESTNRQIRAAYQRVSASAGPAVRALERLAAVIEEQSANLPEKMQLDLERKYVLAVADRIRRFCFTVGTSLPLEKIIKKMVKERDEFQQSPERPRTTAQRTLLLWHHLVENDPAKWEHMHQLARRWHVSDADDIDSFKRYVKSLNREFDWPFN